jgi:hypothetical protein
LEKKHSAKSSLPSVVTRQRNSLPSVKNKTLGKKPLRECFLLPRVFCVALGKELLCRVPEIKHSAKNMALDKELNSGSVLAFGIAENRCS